MRQSGEKSMSDKSYVQAIQDLQDRLSSHSLDTIAHMLTHRTTVSQATLNIQDEHMRTVVKNTLITDQMVALLTLMKDMGILDESQYDEFRAYLRHSLTYQSW
jgi:chemotaxis protein CheY-P-specific phosphatase CheC